MKKIIIGMIVVVALTLYGEMSVTKKIIPDEAIRLRILANSNSKYDQEIKEKVKKELQIDMYSLLKNVNTINDARVAIKSNIESFSNTVKNTLAREKEQMAYTIDFGSHYFPNKEYKGIEYDEGYYESLLVKLGKGTGDNWWCVLFPPLCLLEAEESTDVEYKFFVQEIIDKFF